MKKTLQIVVLILAPIVLAWGVYSLFFATKSVGPEGWTFVDVNTGEVVHRKVGEVISIPMRNAATGDKTFYPVTKNDQGQWVISERYRRDLETLPPDKKSKVDASTFVVNAK